MNNLFNPQNKAMQLLSNLCNIIFVNLIFIITCLPIFTIGAAITSLYRIMFIMHTGNEVFVIKDFFLEFKSNFKKATTIWCILALGTAFFIYELYLIRNVLNSFWSWLQIPIYIFIFLISMIMVYIFPLLASFENSLLKSVKNAFLLSIANFPTTIFLIFLHLSIPLIMDMSNVFLVILLSWLGFCGFALIACFCTLFYRKVFNINTKIDTNIEE